MRLGAPVQNFSTPEQWIASLRQHGYRAAYYPLDADVDIQTHNQYAEAAQRADITIAEVGAWSNPISPEDEIRNAAIEKCQVQLALADEVGARCCVNIAGSRSEKWDGPHPDNLSDDTFNLIVETVQAIIDAVNPIRSFYVLETMPWIFPDSPESYLKLMKAINRKHFAVHLDPVNLINCPHRYFNNGTFLRECFRILGPHIKSCHAKDVILKDTLTVHLDEVRPGLGGLDYKIFLSCINQLSNVSLMLEHLPDEDYPRAAAYIRKTARGIDIPL